jgi:protocatechuate 3,4-dioxygenase beta subunit
MSHQPLNRRDLLKRLGVAGIGGLAGASWLGGLARCSATTPAPARIDPAAVDCVLLPSMTDGPYYFDANQIRSDITEGRPGTPLRLSIGVVDVDDCRPIGDSIVDLWHCDAVGLYSGYNLPGGNTVGEDFMRGIQFTDAGGIATFQTIFPGWYQGRANHMHLKVRLSQTTYITSQLFFPQDIGDSIHTTREPYTARGANPVKNEDDGILRSTPRAEATMASMSPDGDGYTAAITIGIRGLASAAEMTPPAPRIALSSPFPNPTPSVTTLWLTLPRGESKVRIAAFDMSGREVATLHDGALLAGRHAVELDGARLRPGIYAVRVDVGTEILVETVTIAR